MAAQVAEVGVPRKVAAVGAPRKVAAVGDSKQLPRMFPTPALAKT